MLLYWCRYLYRFFTMLGSSPFYMMVVFFFFFFDRPLSFYLLVGYIAHLIIIVLIRLFYFKERPKKQPMTTLFQRLLTSSFPSGHSTRAFFLAMALSTVYPYPFLMLFFLLLAILVSYSRYALHDHDAADVIAGSLLGIFIWQLAFSFFPFFPL